MFGFNRKLKKLQRQVDKWEAFSRTQVGANTAIYDELAAIRSRVIRLEKLIHAREGNPTSPAVITDDDKQG